MTRGTKTGLNLSSSIEIAIIVIPRKGLKATMQRLSLEEERTVKSVFFDKEVRQEPEGS